MLVFPLLDLLWLKQCFLSSNYTIHGIPISSTETCLCSQRTYHQWEEVQLACMNLRRADDSSVALALTRWKLRGCSTVGWHGLERFPSKHWKGLKKPIHPSSPIFCLGPRKRNLCWQKPFDRPSLGSAHWVPSVLMRLYPSAPQLQIPLSVRRAESMALWGLSPRGQCVASQAPCSLWQHPQPRWRTHSWYFRPSQ